MSVFLGFLDSFNILNGVVVIGICISGLVIFMCMDVVCMIEGKGFGMIFFEFFGGGEFLYYVYDKVCVEDVCVDGSMLMCWSGTIIMWFYCFDLIENGVMCRVEFGW